MPHVSPNRKSGFCPSGLGLADLHYRTKVSWPSNYSKEPQIFKSGLETIYAAKCTLAIHKCVYIHKAYLELNKFVEWISIDQQRLDMTCAQDIPPTNQQFWFSCLMPGSPTLCPFQVQLCYFNATLRVILLMSAEMSPRNLEMPNWWL